MRLDFGIRQSRSKITAIGFITEWTVSGDAVARTITLPLVQSRAEGALSYNCTVDWGDGSPKSTITAYNDSDRAHTYAANGTYQVTITGTCEGWSFNNGGDKLKIRRIINWGNIYGFNGFKYLKGGFHGCTNLTSLGTGKILASGTGVLTDGFENTFQACAFTTIPTGLFDNHTELTTNGFKATFYNNTALNAIPANLFDKATKLTTYGFNQTFMLCSSITSIPTDLFKYNTLLTQWAFNQTFRTTSITSIPTDLFRYNVNVTIYAFRDCFQQCHQLTAIPTDLFRYNTLVSTNAFEGTFIECYLITTVPTDLFRYNTLVSGGGFFATFYDCTGLQTVPNDLFKYNTLVGEIGFQETFKNCNKLQINPNVFGSDLAARFADSTVPISFLRMFDRASFTGTQGTAPALWDVAWPDVLELSTRPATLWVAGDIITGQTSGATSTFIAWYGTWKILVKNLSGTYTSDEVIGVTGVPGKLANQAAGYPIKTNAEIPTDCFNGAGNSLTSISNYSLIPALWK